MRNTDEPQRNNFFGSDRRKIFLVVSGNEKKKKIVTSEKDCGQNELHVVLTRLMSGTLHLFYPCIPRSVLRLPLPPSLNSCTSFIDHTYDFSVKPDKSSCSNWTQGYDTVRTPCVFFFSTRGRTSPYRPVTTVCEGLLFPTPFPFRLTTPLVRRPSFNDIRSKTTVRSEGLPLLWN